MCHSSRTVYSVFLVSVFAAAGTSPVRAASTTPVRAGGLVSSRPVATRSARTGFDDQAGNLAQRAARQAARARQAAAIAQAGGLAGGSRNGRRFDGLGQAYRNYGGFDPGFIGSGIIGYGGFASGSLGDPGYPPPDGHVAGARLIPTAGPCLPPRLIKVEGGLRKPPATRVTYGSPPCGF